MRKTFVSTLENGLRVASTPSPAHFMSVGIYVSAGSRCENDQTTGCTHLMDRLAFKSTKSITAEKLVDTLENLGGNIMSQGSRESFMYQASIFPKDLSKTISTFASMANEPLFDPNEVQSTKESMLWEIENRKFNTDETLPEVLHSIAYGESGNAHVNTLGNPLYHSEESLGRLNSDILRDFHSTWFTPNRMVVAGVGVNHQEFVELVSKSFEAIKSPSKEILDIQTTLPLKYTGGTLITDTSSHPPHPNPENMLLTHVHVGFEAFSASDPDIYALATYVSLMGGGGSFSAGGPGKGMYTRVYRTVLNRYGWVESCHAVHHPYSDSSLFVIKIAVPPSSGSHTHVVDVVCDQLVGMIEKIEADELSRAKNQLKSSLLMSLESRLTESEDIGRQLITFNKRLDVLEVCKRIDSLTIEDLKRVARRVILGSNESSPLNFNDPCSVPWKRTGDGKASVLVWGNLQSNDFLYRINDRMTQWGIKAAQPQRVEIKRNWMDRLKMI